MTALGGARTREFFEAAGALMGQDDDPSLTMAAAVATYLAFRRDGVDDDPGDVLRLATRAEFGDDVPQGVAEWLALAGVDV